MDHEGETKILDSKAREARRRRDTDDFNNEIAGRDVGRIKRFLPESADPAEAKKRDGRDHQRLSTLMALLQNDPEYAALYEDTLDELREAEEATDAAMEKALEDIENAKTPEARDKAQDRYDALLRYRVDVLGHARDRVMDEDNPPTKEELEKIKRDIEEQMPKAVASELDTSATPAMSAPQNISVLAPPDIGN